ncbi:hypothetical protein A2U01_0108353, partial [Trifolium medium]|nr:hypothetical protein [Trifolium medium]
MQRHTSGCQKWKPGTGIDIDAA